MHLTQSATKTSPAAQKIKHGSMQAEDTQAHPEK